MPMLSVTLLKCTDLVAADCALKGGKSDPWVRFELGNQKSHSTTIDSSLDPVWEPAEKFEFEVEDPQMDVLRVDVKDHDTLSRDELIGSALIPISRFIDTAGTTVADAIPLKVPAEFGAQKKSSVIHLEIKLEALDDTGIVMRVWENEKYSTAAGWYPSDAKDRLQWSSYKGTETSNDFDEIAGAVPNGMDAQGWGYVVKKGDQQGWMYAVSWFGPWTTKMNATTYVRRRLWENHCTLKPDAEAAQ